MIDSHHQLLCLLKVALGTSTDYPSVADWPAVIKLAARQNVMGMVYLAVCRLPQEYRPSLAVMMKLEDFRQKIEQNNLRLNQLCGTLDARLTEGGYRAVVIKGQGVAALYEKPLLRSWGDIDMWMDGGKDEVVKCVRSHFSRVTEPGDYHIAATLTDGTELEMHYLPTVMTNPLLNRRWKQWLEEQRPQQWDNLRELPQNAGSIHVPTAGFDVVFLMLHFFRHWSFEGCGLKQLLDIYHVLLRAEIPLNEAYEALCRLGMKRMAQAIMYVMGELGLPRNRMICEPDVYWGKRFLDDVMQTGWVSADEMLTGKIGQERNLHKLARRLWRHLRLLPLAPLEIPLLLPMNVWHKLN